jgi:Predicted nucleic acid-binding protein, consists of a PIN domain and a Zn-ribbon module
MTEPEIKDRRVEKYVADSAVFIMGNCNIPYSQMVTITLVEDEIRSEDARLRYDIAKAEGLRVEAVDSAFLTEIIKQAECTRDIEKLSKTDLGVLAKALEYKETDENPILITDDFAVQNIAARLDIEVMPVAQRIIKDKIIWQKQCTGCFRHYKDGDDCPVCGSPLRKKMKKKSEKKPKTI